MKKRSNQIILASLSLALGIITAQLNTIHIPLFWMLSVGVVLVVSILFKARFQWLLVTLLLFMFGVSYVNLRADLLHRPRLNSFVGTKVEISGRVSSTPHWDDQGLYEFEIAAPTINHVPTSGVLRIKSLSSFAAQGDMIQSSGKLYHAMGRAEAQLIYAPINRLDSNRSWQLKAKQNITNSLAVVFPPPINQFMEGIIIGDRSGLPKSIQDQLANLGLSHIVAVSGYNLTIVILMATYLLKHKWKWLSLVLSLWVIAGFVLITGATASVVRAGVMSSVFLITRYYGKSIGLPTALFLTLAITLLIAPSNYSDIGWQLSFAALAGIIFLTPPLLRLLPSRPKWLMNILAVSVAAQITTLPIVAYYFGSLSLLAPIANAICMPFIEVLSIIGFVAVLFGLLIPQVAALLFAPVNLVVRGLLALVKIGNDIHFSHISINQPTLANLILYYCLVASFAALYLPRAKKSAIIAKKDSYERSQQMA